MDFKKGLTGLLVGASLAMGSGVAYATEYTRGEINRAKETLAIERLAIEGSVLDIAKTLKEGYCVWLEQAYSQVLTDPPKISYFGFPGSSKLPIVYEDKTNDGITPDDEVIVPFSAFGAIRIPIGESASYPTSVLEAVQVSNFLIESGNRNTVACEGFQKDLSRNGTSLYFDTNPEDLNDKLRRLE